MIGMMWEVFGSCVSGVFCNLWVLRRCGVCRMYVLCRFLKELEEGLLV